MSWAFVTASLAGNLSALHFSMVVWQRNQRFHQYLLTFIESECYGSERSLETIQFPVPAVGRVVTHCTATL